MQETSNSSQGDGAVRAIHLDFYGVDSDCPLRGGCDATSASTAFALEASGKIYTLDAAGNAKVQTAMSSRADRAVDPANPQSKAVMAKVSGIEKGGTITVDSIDVQ